jgi:uncharacterized membrane protein HdeD (DUF308 family)
MTTDLIQSAYRRTWWALVLRGLLGIAVGVVILWRPLESVAAFALFIAIWALFSGIVQMVHAFDLRSLLDRWWLLLVSGLVSGAFGVAALHNYPGLSLAFAVIWSAAWLLTTGALTSFAAVVERQAGAPWGWTLACGIVSIGSGLLAILHPPTTLAVLMSIIAAFGIVSGAGLLIGACRLSSLKRKVSRMVSTATVH